MSSRQALAALLACAFAAAVAAQDATPRGKFAGFVRDDAGKRVAGADVTLLSRPVPGRPDLGIADELRVRTSTDGMFRTELLHGRAYSAWAAWRDEAGADHRTRVLDGAIPGPPMALDEAPAQVTRSVVLAGVDAWNDRAPFRLTAFTSDENGLALPLTLDAGCRAKLPVLPGDYADIEVRDRAGSVLAVRVAVPLATDKACEVTFELPPPRELRVEVVDDQGAPVGGALVRHTFGQHYRRDIAVDLGRTAANGALSAIVPATNPLYGKESNASFSLLVEAPGRQRTIFWGDLTKLGGKAKVALRAGSELRGRVLGKDGAPVPGLTLLPECYAMGADAETTGAGVLLRPVALDAHGRFSFCSLHPRYDFRLLALLEPGASIAAGLRFRPDVAVAPVLWLAVGKPPFASPHDLGEVRLGDLVTTCIEVKDHDGVPVPGARLAVTTGDLYNSPLQYVTDRVGRLQFVLPKGELRIGAWVPGGGVATRLVRVPPGPDDAPLQPLAMSLSATRTVRGVVVDEQGKPVAGATVMQWNRALGVDKELADLTFHARATFGPTGADGAFTLTLPLDDAAFAVRAWVGIGEAAFQSEQHVVNPNDADADRLRLAVLPWKPDK